MALSEHHADDQQQQEQQHQQHPTILRIKRRRRDDHEALDALGALVASLHPRDRQSTEFSEADAGVTAYAIAVTVSHRSA